MAVLPVGFAAVSRAERPQRHVISDFSQEAFWWWRECLLMIMQLIKGPIILAGGRRICWVFLCLGQPQMPFRHSVSEQYGNLSNKYRIVCPFTHSHPPPQQIHKFFVNLANPPKPVLSFLEIPSQN